MVMSRNNEYLVLKTRELTFTENTIQWNSWTEANNFVKPAHQWWQLGHSPPHTPPTLPINLTHTSRVHPVVILIENINQIPQPHTLQACKFIILIPFKKATSDFRAVIMILLPQLLALNKESNWPKKEKITTMVMALNKGAFGKV